MVRAMISSSIDVGSAAALSGCVCFAEAANDDDPVEIIPRNAGNACPGRTAGAWAPSDALFPGAISRHAAARFVVIL